MNQFLKEVNEQNDVVKNTLDNNVETKMKFDVNKPFLFTGMGSSLAASYVAATFLNHHGLSAKVIDSSELYYYQMPTLEEYNVVMISQSGESVEILNILEHFQNVTAITNNPDSTLANKSKSALFICAGEEKAVASSKSYTSTVTLLLQIASKIAGKDMTEDLYKSIPVIEDILKNQNYFMKLIGSFLNENKSLMLIGRGPSVTTAEQGGLILKETARIFTESLSVAQFRHGPLELLGDELQCVCFNPKGRTSEKNAPFIKDIADKGGKVIYVSDGFLAHENILSLQIPSVNEYVSAMIYNVINQLMAVELSTKKGLTLKETKFISKVTVQE